jgi:CelD/BcsL family acetyltransferase involved in cellulose biosynthesis
MQAGDLGLDRDSAGAAPRLRHGEQEETKETEVGLHFQAYQGTEGLERIAHEWMALAESMPGAGFAHYPSLYRAYLASSRCDPASVWFIAAYRDNRRLAAIFPLQFQSRRVIFLRPRFLGTIDDDELQLSDFVFAQTPENATLVFELTQWLRKQRVLRWDQLRMLKIPDDSSFAYAARARLPRMMLAEPYDGSAYFDTRGTYEQATQAMSNKFRSNLRRRRRLAESAAPLRFQCYRRREEIDAGFNVFLEVEASGWKGLEGSSSAIRCRPDMLSLYTELVREFAVRGECVINVLWHGEQAIAGQFALRSGRTLNILKVGYRDSHAAFAPGILLHELTIRHACEDPGIDTLSLVNDPPWAKSFRPASVEVRLYSAPNWNARGLCGHLGLLVKRKWKARASRAAAESTQEQA